MSANPAKVDSDSDSESESDDSEVEGPVAKKGGIGLRNSNWPWLVFCTKLTSPASTSIARSQTPISLSTSFTDSDVIH